MENKNLAEKIFSSPASALDSSIETSKRLLKSLQKQKPVKKAGQFWHMLGPGLTTGAADDDPSGVATYTQAGAKYGLNLLWLAPLTFPLMAVVQEICARIGLVTGAGLARNIRRHFPKQVLYVSTALLFLANTFNIGADLGAMAKTTQLLLPQASFELLVAGFAIASLLLQIFMSYASYAKFLKWLALILLAYILSAAFIDINGAELLAKSLTPSFNFSRDQAFLICAIFGTTISPYLFFWQTSQEVEEEILAGKTTAKLRKAEVPDKEINNMRIDVWTGMFFSNLVMFFIIVTSAAALHANGITDIQTASDAAAALKPLAGRYAYLLFTMGIIGTGMLAIPVLAGSASYALSESFGWKEGLYRKLKQAHAFYGVIIVSMLLGLLMNFTGLDPIKTLIYSAVANGLIAPVVLTLIMLISGNKKIMGNRANGPVTKAIGWTAVGLMSITGLLTLLSFF